jgi:hypothetical protein
MGLHGLLQEELYLYFNYNTLKYFEMCVHMAQIHVPSDVDCPDAQSPFRST